MDFSIGPLEQHGFETLMIKYIIVSVESLYYFVLVLFQDLQRVGKMVCLDRLQQRKEVY